MGLSWGLAQEAGRAVAQLSAMGLPALDMMAGLIKVSSEIDYDLRRPFIKDGYWQAAGPALCPIVTGCALADRLELLMAQPQASHVCLTDSAAESLGRKNGRKNAFIINTGPLWYPMLVAGLVLLPLARAGYVVQLNWGVVSLVGNRDSLSCSADLAKLRQPLTSAMTIQLFAVMSAPAIDADMLVLTPTHDRCDADAVSIERLSRYAHRTYVPATDSARTGGAGANLLDTD